MTLHTTTAVTTARFWLYVEAWRAARAARRECATAPDGSWCADLDRTDLGNLSAADDRALVSARSALASLVAAHEASTVGEVAAKVEVACDELGRLSDNATIALTARETDLLREGLATIEAALAPVRDMAATPCEGTGGARRIGEDGRDEPARFMLTGAGAELLRSLAGQCPPSE